MWRARSITVCLLRIKSQPLLWKIFLSNIVKRFGLIHWHHQTSEGFTGGGNYTDQLTKTGLAAICRIGWNGKCVEPGRWVICYCNSLCKILWKPELGWSWQTRNDSEKYLEMSLAESSLLMQNTLQKFKLLVAQQWHFQSPYFSWESTKIQVLC